MGRVVAVLVTMGALLAACGGDDRERGADREDYPDDLAAVIAELQRTGDVAFEPVELAIAADDVDLAMAAAPAAADDVAAAVLVAQASVGELEPLRQHRDDQLTVLRILADLEDGLAEVASKARAAEADAFLERFADLDRVVEAGQANLSPAIAGRIAVASTVLEEFPDLTDDEIAHLGAVNAAFLEFTARNAEFAEAVNRSYSGSSALLDALVEAGAGTAWAAVRDPVSDLEPPDTLADAHDRVLTYLDEAVEADERVLAAAEAGDFVMFLVANEQLASAARSARLDVTGPMARAVFPGASAPPDVFVGDEAGREVWRQSVVLADLFLGDDFPGYRPFPVASEEETVAAIAEVAIQRQGWLDRVADELVTIDGEGGSAAGVEDVLAYVGRLQELHEVLVASAAAGDVATTTATLDRLVLAWCGAGAELNPQLGVAVEAHLGTTSVDPRCDA